MRRPVSLYLVEDNADHVNILRRILQDDPSHDFRLEEFSDSVQMFQALQTASTPPDLILLDYRVPGRDGLAILRELKETSADIPVIMMTSYASVEAAVAAIKEGAFDYLTKPFRNPQNVLLSLAKALRHREILLENRFLRRQIGHSHAKPMIIGKSPEMLRIQQIVTKIAPTNSTVLITGESGTGKEVLAHTIHAMSPRAQEKFVAVNCSALPENLLESELFGHVKGAFTGAAVNKNGLLKEADGGTFFLDEIGELPTAMQTKLLRFLQDQEIRQIGSVRTEVVDVRIIAASNVNLAQDVEKGRFREDLFYRLNVIHLHLPALQKRQEDIAAFVDYFIEEYNAKEGRKIKGIEEDALQDLKIRAWPGNIRQLKNVIERALIFTENGGSISRRGLGFLKTPMPPESGAETAPSGEVTFEKARKTAVSEFTHRYLRRLLREHRGNVTEAASAAGLGRQSFHRLLKMHRIRARDFRLST